MKKLFVLFLVTLFILAACAKVSQKEEVVIGWIGPLTGDVAFLGIANKQGVELAVEEINSKGGINGKPLRVVYEDDAYDAKKTVTAFQKLIQFDKVSAVLTPSYSGLLSAANMAEENKVLLVNSLDTSEEIANAGDWIFGVGIYDEGIGHTLAEHLHKTGIEKVGIIYFQDDAFLPLVKDGFTDRYVSLGGEVVLTEGFATGEADFRSRLLKMQEAGVEAIGILSYDEGGFILKQGRELGIDVLYFGADTVTSPNFIANANNNVDGLLFTFWAAEEEQRVQEFKQKVIEKTGEEPEVLLFAGVGYDATFVVANALRSEDPKAAMYALKDFPGLTGVLTMSPDGIVRTISEEIYKFEGTDYKRVE